VGTTRARLAERSRKDSAVTYFEMGLREQVCEIGRNLWNRGMVAANDGNISALMSDGRVLCTPTGVSKGYLTPSMLPVVDLEGRVLEQHGQYRPSSEIKMHLRIYQASLGAGAVVHAHPMYGTVFAVKGEAIATKMLPECVVAMPEVPLARYATPSTAAVADSVEPFALTHSVCLLEQHGALSWGPDLMAAYLTMERLEYTAKMTYLLRQIGGERDLADDEIARLHSLFDMQKV
jgi:L-fuculose-phosphate aldolase